MRLKSGRISPITKTLKFFSHLSKNLIYNANSEHDKHIKLIEQFTIFREFVSLVFTWDLQPAKQSPEAPPTHVSS